MKSIIQDHKYCYFCGSPYTECHHVRLNNISRKRAEKYGLIAYLCARCHRALHINEPMKRALQIHAQKALEEEIGHEQYMKEIGKNYV